MFAFVVVLLFIGLLISSLSLYDSFGKRDKNRVAKILGFEIKNLGKLLAISYVALFIISIIVLIDKLNRESEFSIQQQLIFDDVGKVKKGMISIDSLVQIQIDSLNIFLDSSKSNSKAFSELDSLTKLALKNRKEALNNFTESNNELRKAMGINIKLSERNRALSEQLLINEIGGNSYPLVKPIFFGISEFFDKDEINLEVVNIGNYTQKNVRIKIRDLTAEMICLEKDTAFTDQCRPKSNYEYSIGDLFHSGFKNLGNSENQLGGNLQLIEGVIFHKVELEENQKNVYLEIVIRSNNGVFTQNLSIANWNGRDGYSINHRMTTSILKTGYGEIFRHKGVLYPKIKSDTSSRPKYLDPFKIY